MNCNIVAVRAPERKQPETEIGTVRIRPRSRIGKEKQEWEKFTFTSTHTPQPDRMRSQKYKNFLKIPCLDRK